MNFSTYIISSGRANNVKTIRALGIELLNPILVVPIGQEEEYRKHNQKIEVISSEKGISEARNAALNHSRLERVIMFDDDIRQVSILCKSMTGKNTLRKLNSLEIETFIQNAFLMCEQKKLFHWGVYPVHNAFYMKLGVSHIAFINGSFSGYIKDGILFDEEMPLKEDYDFSARQIKKHGAILRFNFVAADAAHRNNKGGAFEI
jgi:glycosyltransferase involved in cell wall biosynthesis